MSNTSQGIVLDEKAQEQPKDKERAQDKSSRNLPGQAPRKDTEREMHDAVVEDADKTDVADRDRAHGDGKSLGLN